MTVIDLGINIPSTSYAAVLHMVRTANEMNLSVSAEILGVKLVVSPGDCPECIYKQFYGVECPYHGDSSSFINEHGIADGVYLNHSECDECRAIAVAYYKDERDGHLRRG